MKNKIDYQNEEIKRFNKEEEKDVLAESSFNEDTDKCYVFGNKIKR